MKKSNGKEVMIYAFWGATTTLVNIIVYFLLSQIVDYKLANIIAIIFCKIYAYIVNKVFVFHSKCDSILELFREMGRYIFARGLTGLVDFLGLMLLVEVVGCNDRFSKVLISAIVIVLNYVLGKKKVFRNERIHTEE